MDVPFAVAMMVVVYANLATVIRIAQKTLQGVFKTDALTVFPTTCPELAALHMNVQLPRTVLKEHALSPNQETMWRVDPALSTQIAHRNMLVAARLAGTTVKRMWKVALAHLIIIVHLYTNAACKRVTKADQNMANRPAFSTKIAQTVFIALE